MTVIYFFIGHFSDFWVFFTSVRNTLKYLVVNVEKLLRWRLQTLFFAFTENIFPGLVGSCYWDSFRFDQSKNIFGSINKFLEQLWANSLGLTFKKSEVGSSCSQKHLGLLLDERVNVNELIQRKMNKCYKIIEVIRKLLPHLHVMHY